MSIERFTPHVEDAVLDDLRDRIRRTRWPIGVTDGGGIPLEEMREIARYWERDFDWRASEREIHRFEHFRADGIHFIHQRGGEGATPLLLLHGWPGSFLEFLEMLPMLGDAFDVVVPSLPGYGFSDPPLEPGMTNQKIADRFASLMTQLGYETFLVQGGDWGAGIATWMARRHPHRLRAMHLNYIPGSLTPHAEELSEEEQQFLRDRDRWVEQSGAYGAIQRTRPLTVAYALNDSPVGLASWIVEKFREWADPASSLSLDKLLTNVTLYWVTQTIGSSVRLYHESPATPLRFERGERLRVPCAIARFPFEAPFPPRSWIERVYDVRRWTDMPRGGHFAAMEAPELLAADIRTLA